MTRWNPKKTLVHLALSTATKGLGLISEDSVRRRIERSKHDLSELISGDFLPEKIKSILADGLDEYAVSLKKVMDPVWQREFPNVHETVDDFLHVGERGRSLLKREISAESPREVRAAATR